MADKIKMNRTVKKGMDYLLRYHPKEIILFGSFADGTFDKSSDIDLAVSGISPEDFFTAVVDISSFVGRRVDLVLLGHVNGRFEAIVRKRGKVLYAA